MFLRISDDVWIQGDSQMNGMWKVDQELLPYVQWRLGEPNDVGGNEDCILLAGSGMVDYPCSGTAKLACDETCNATTYNLNDIKFE